MGLSGLAALTQSDLITWAQQAKAATTQGQVANRIPLLSQTDPQGFAVNVQAGNYCVSWGDNDRSFPLMSVVKPFLLLYLLEQYGMERVFGWVGMQPSDAPFNSLEQLIADRGRPRNPMINSGAITLADKLPGRGGHDRCQLFVQWLNQQAGCQFTLDEFMLASVRSAGREPNQALISHLVRSGYVQTPDIALDAYEQICCLSGRVHDLAQLGQLLTHAYPSITPQYRCTVNALMLTCGLYEASPAYAIRIGLPIKSGISGALLTVVPQQGAIACYSPALDRVGNPIAGLAFVERLAQAMQLSLFG